MISNAYCNFEAFVVTDPGMTPLQRRQLLTEDDYYNKLDEYGDDFDAKMGAEGIRELLRTLDIAGENRNPASRAGIYRF